MRRPLTVRWWFRVALVLICIVGGYGAAYVCLRSITPFRETVVIEYGEARRFYMTSDSRLMENYMQTHSVVQDNERRWRYADDWSSRSTGFSSDEPTRWYGVFYPAERVELLLRGYTLHRSDTEQLAERFDARVRVWMEPLETETPTP